MHFLLSNDDGYQAHGLRVLAKALAQKGRVTVVAPDRDRSGASNSLTLDAPLYVKKDSAGYYYVNGTPTDCVHLAITGLLDTEPDMVISGINAGSNLGDDVLYSGTVAAAMEGRYLGCPAIAVSLAGENPSCFDVAVKVIIKLIDGLISTDVNDDLLLNVNIPDLPLESIRGYEVTRLGNRHKSEPAQEARDPKGCKVYWVGPVGPEQDAGPGTDFYAVKSGSVSVTPLQVDLTRYQILDHVARWLEDLL
jgi:5'-nucleotidase